MATWIIGDIHGMYNEFIELLEKVNFKPEKDTLISLGDLVDRGPDSFKVVEHIISLPNKICIRGNHDKWWEQYLKQGTHPIEFHHGADKTYNSYVKECQLDEYKLHEHLIFFEQQKNYYLDDNGNLFVHGGFNRHYTLDEHKDSNIFYWDRDMFTQSLANGLLSKWGEQHANFKFKDTRIKRVFVGHTPTINFNISNNKEPIFAARGKVINLDTGACFKHEGGRLTIMNLDTLKYVQV